MPTQRQIDLMTKRAAEKAAEDAAAARTLELEKQKAEAKAREEEKKRRAEERRAEQEREKEEAAKLEASKREKEQLKAELRRLNEEAARHQREDEEWEASVKAAQMDFDAGTEEAVEEMKEDVDVADEKINEHLSDINNMEDAGEQEKTNAESEEEDDGGKDADPSSPRKKKQKSSKKEKKESKKEKKKKKKEKESDKAVDQGDKPPSSLKASRKYAGVGFQPTAQRKAHKHKYPRVLVESSIVLAAPGGPAEKMNEFTAALKSLMTNALSLDPHFQIEPHASENEFRVPGHSEPFFHPDDIPRNHSIMSFHIRTSGGGDAFKMQKPWKNNKDKDGKRRRNQNREEDSEEEPELIDPQVRFSMAFATDIPPLELLDRISCEWGKVGGQKFYLKDFPTFDTDFGFMALKMSTRISFDTIKAEMSQIFTEAMQILLANQGSASIAHLYTIPQVGVRLNTPKLPGQDTSVFSGWSNKQQAKRKAFNFEVEASQLDMVHKLITLSKQHDIVKKYWGKNAHLSNIEKNSYGQVKLSAKELKNLCAMARSHVNFGSSMLTDCLEGVTDLDKPIAFYSASDKTKVAGTMTLRHVLYNYVTLMDGKIPLFVEIHQASPAAGVEVVIPNTPQATELLDEINNNLAAFLHYSLQLINVDSQFLHSLLASCVDAAMCQDIQRCSWDSKTFKLTTPGDAAREKAMAMESAAWYRDEFGDHMVGKKKEAPREFANEEMMYDHDADTAVNTIHEKKGANYKGSPGAPTLQVGVKPTEEIGVRKLDDDELSQLSDWDKGALIEHIKKMQLGVGSKGSQPNRDSKPSAADDPSTRAEDEAIELSSASSSSSESGSSESSDSVGSATTKAASATPSDGGSKGDTQAAASE